MSRKLGKKNLVNLLRSAKITKEEANILYEHIKEKILLDLERGNTVNLFGIVNLVPFKYQDKVFTGFVNSKVSDGGFRIKPVINRTIKDLFRKRSQNKGGILIKV